MTSMEKKKKTAKRRQRRRTIMEEGGDLTNLIESGQLMMCLDQLRVYCERVEYANIELSLYLCQGLRRKARTPDDLAHVHNILTRVYALNSQHRKTVDMLCLHEFQFADGTGTGTGTGTTDAHSVPLRRLVDAGYWYRLADPILCYDRHAVLPYSGSDCVWAFDNVFPPSVLGALQAAFDATRETENFWTENHYSEPSTGFFSFTHPLHFKTSSSSSASSSSSSSSPSSPDDVCFMDRVIEHVYTIMLRRVPGLCDARYAEWWAHCRYHGDGHQLHFDSADEGRGAAVRHPICTAIVYLAGEGCESGGPTLVTTQTRTESRLAERGWLAYPRVNRMVALDGRYLHGVVPSRECAGTDDRRTTVMISFWQENEMISPFPPKGDGVTWTRRLTMPYQRWWRGDNDDGDGNDDNDDNDVVGGHGVVVPLVGVAPIWIPLADNVPTDVMPHYSQCYQGL